MPKLIEIGIQTILEEELSLYSGRVIANILRNKQSASGALINSFKVHANPFGGDVTALDYIENLEKGTKPGTYVSAKKIYEWAEAKGLSWMANSPTLANKVSWNINNKGSLLFRKGGRKDVYSNESDLLVRNIMEKATNVILETKLL